MASVCEPRFRADGMRLLGGCVGPQPDWVWTARSWQELDKNGEPTGLVSGIDYALCPDCELMWNRAGGSPVSTPIGPRERTTFRTIAALERL